MAGIGDHERPCIESERETYLQSWNLSPKMTNPDISIVVPAYNEAERISTALATICDFIESIHYRCELLVVDDGSTDNTYEIARRFADHSTSCRTVIIRNNRNRGKGYSVRRGFLEATGNFVLMTDADLSTPIGEFSKLEKKVIHGDCDLAIGSRALPGSRVEIRQAWPRQTAGKIYNLLVRWILRIPHRDTQCGFKLFNSTSCRGLFEVQAIGDFGFDVEIIFVARKRRLKVGEVPVVWRNRKASRVQFSSDAPRMFWDLFKVRWNDARGRYDNWQ